MTIMCHFVFQTDRVLDFNIFVDTNVAKMKGKIKASRLF